MGVRVWDWGGGEVGGRWGQRAWAGPGGCTQRGRGDVGVWAGGQLRLA